ncbi:alpha/beta hydrolase [Kamptonema formosum]|uniref:alpha/beta hydrolase n=1 Tax=Kamptonema formosum TaxID=331992 RepID=UPI000346DBA1|nr:alpha/beta fold hydrolase [Oscillatoria sp. PCC 10802]
MPERDKIPNPKSKIPVRPTGLLLGVLLLAFGLLLCAAFNPSAVQSESVAIHTDAGGQLVARLYTPKTAPAPHPVMVLCHGVSASKEVMSPLAAELARHGIAAIAFDFSGFGESARRGAQPFATQNTDSIDGSNRADARAVLDYLRANPQRFDLRRQGIAGHSLGARTALELAQADPQLRATIMLGMSGIASPTVPKNLFAGVGLYEQLNPPQEARTMIQQATGTSPSNFAAGTARMLAVSPTADHLTAPYDPFLLRQAVRWAQLALDVPSGNLPPVVPWYILGLLLTQAGGLATGVFMFLRAGAPVVHPQARQLYRGCAVFVIVALASAVWGLGSTGAGPSRGASTVLLFCLALLVVTNYALRSPEKFPPAVRVFALYSIVCLEIFALPALLCGSGEILAHPAYLAGLPQFLLQWPVFLLYNCSHLVKLAFFPAYSLKLQFSWLFLSLMWLEVIWPGMILTGLESAAVKAVSQLRRPLRLTGTGRISRRLGALLAVLVLLLVGILYLRFQQGVLSVAASNVALTLQMVGQMLLLPVVAIVFVVRSGWFRRLERRCLR